MGLDGDASFPLDIQLVEKLLFHFTGGQSPRFFEQAIGERGFPMIDMGDDTEISDAIWVSQLIYLNVRSIFKHDTERRYRFFHPYTSFLTKRLGTYVRKSLYYIL